MLIRYDPILDNFNIILGLFGRPLKNPKKSNRWLQICSRAKTKAVSDSDNSEKGGSLPKKGCQETPHVLN